jgi:hypothetical protein
MLQRMKNRILQRVLKSWLRKKGMILKILAGHWIDESTFDEVAMIAIVGREGTLLGIVAPARRLEILVFVTNHTEAFISQ